jgi:hypothetical protein
MSQSLAIPSLLSSTRSLLTLLALAAMLPAMEAQIQAQAQAADLIPSSAASAPASNWSRSLHTPFELGAPFGSSTRLSLSRFPNSAGFSPVWQSLALGARQNPLRLNPFSTPGAALANPLLGNPDASNPALIGSASSGNRQLGFAQPGLTQLMHPSLALPFGSSLGGLRFSHRDFLAPGFNQPEGAPLRNSAIFTTSNFGNGVVFSAGTNVGGHSTAGASTGAFGSANASAPRRSGPGIALKLSF